jgi:hypothetical protein
VRTPSRGQAVSEFPRAIPSCVYYRHPHWATPPLASSGVILSHASVMA